MTLTSRPDICVLRVNAPPGTRTHVYKHVQQQSCPCLKKTHPHSLQRKHPQAKPPTPSATIEGETAELHPILFEKFNGSLIRKIALRTKGAAGPSGLDAEAWRRICTSFQSASSDLCDPLVCTAKKICVENVHHDGF